MLGNYHIKNIEARVLPVHSNHRDAGDMERFNTSTRCKKDSSREFGTLAKAPTSKEKRERFLASTRTNRSELLRTLPRFWRSRNCISHHAESQQAFCDRYSMSSVPNQLKFPHAAKESLVIESFMERWKGSRTLFLRLAGVRRGFRHVSPTASRTQMKLAS